MFQSARLKLTAWYLLIIMFISISFSVVIYRGLTEELHRVERVQRLRQMFYAQGLGVQNPNFRLDPGVLRESERRIRLALISINLIILGVSGAAGYFLAGRTLRPIKVMVEEQNRFITDASHELRTPLTSLKSEIEVGLRNKNFTISEAKKLLESNLEEVNSLQALSDDLIRLAQYKGYNGVVMIRMPLSLILEKAIAKVIPLARRKHIAIRNNTRPYTIRANKQALIELFVILLDNAIKYSPSKSTITIAGDKKDGTIRIHVTDQGMGIDQKDLPHIFDRFYRADKSRTKTGIAGYGLGLSIARQIAERHNGAIKVTSTLQKGSTFTVELRAST